MKYRMVALFLVIFFSLFTGISAAEVYPVDVTITFDDNYLVADGVDQTNIRVQVFDRETGQTLPNLPVSFSITSVPGACGGLITGASTQTDSSGEASAVFEAGEIPCIATLTVNVEYSGNIYPWSRDIYVRAYPDTIIFVTDTPWLTAAVPTNSRLTLTALNNSNPIPMLDIQYILDNADLGTISASSGRTDINGVSRINFTPKTKSGNATITARILFEGTQIDSELFQRIDHNTPYRYGNLSYTTRGLVGSLIPVDIQLLDYYGNLVDSKNTGKTSGEKVNVSVDYSPADLAYIVEEGSDVKYVLKSVDDSGNINIDLRLDTVPGENRLLLIPQSSIPDRTLNIQGTAEGDPYMIFATVKPSVQYQPADGISTSTFSLTYKLIDEYGNGLNGKTIDVNTNLNESYSLNTTYDGTATLYYGPKLWSNYLPDGEVYVTLVANPRENATITTGSLVQFYDPRPDLFNLFAMPTDMPSRDVVSDFNATIIAKITDEKGKPVPGQTVSFEIVNTTPYPVYQTVDPFFIGSGTTTISALTDSEGLAMAYFAPGTFAKQGEPDFSPVSNASCNVTAQWINGKTSILETRDVALKWENYPFISIYTSVSNTSATVGDTIDVNVKVEGRGLPVEYRQPMSVVLATSRARSMLEEYPDRMVWAYAAEHLFIDKITSSVPLGGSDSIGLLTFGPDPTGTVDILDVNHGWSRGDAGIDAYTTDDVPYIAANYPGNLVTYYHGEGAEWEQPMTSNPLVIKDKINYTVPYGTENQNEMPLRLAIYKAITALRTTDNNIRAIVVLVDSEITDYGDVLAEGNPFTNPRNMNGCTQKYYPFTGPDGTWGTRDPQQNMVTYANNNNIKIYVVYTATGLNNCDETTLTTLAESTGGAFNKTTAENLPTIYDWIATQLFEDAAINALMELNFGTVDVNGAALTYDPADPVNTSAFDYVYVPNVSTRVKSYINQSGTVTMLEDYTINQTDDFNEDHILSFTIGTVRLQQIWDATFRLRVLKEGYIDIFGNSSVINFTHPLFGESSYDTIIGYIPISVLPDPTVDEETAELEIIRFFPAAVSANSVALDWAISYTGTKVPHEKIYVRNLDKGESFRQVGNMHDLGGLFGYSTFGLESGTYEFKIEAWAPGTPLRVSTTTVNIEKKPFFIKLM